MINQLHAWYVSNRRFLNLSAIESEYQITSTYLHKFAKQGKLLESAVYGIMKFALEHGFKHSATQIDFELDSEMCKLYFLEQEQVHHAQFTLGQVYDEYKRERKNLKKQQLKNESIY